MLLAEGTVGEDRLADTDIRYLRPDFDHFTYAYIAQPVGIADHLTFLCEQAQPVVVAAAVAGIALEHRHLRAMFGRAEAAFDTYLVGCERLALILAKCDFHAGGGDQFSKHC